MTEPEHRESDPNEVFAQLFGHSRPPEEPAAPPAGQGLDSYDERADPRSPSSIAYAMAPFLSRVRAVQSDVTALRARVDTLAGGTEQVAELREQLAEVAVKLAKTSKSAGQVYKLAAEIAVLTDQLEELAAAADKPAATAPVNWFTMNRAEATEAWEMLISWLDNIAGPVYGLLPPKVIQAQQDSDKVRWIKPCWFEHWDVVAELTWLAQAWLDAYQGPAASLRLVADWHERHLRPVMERLTYYSTYRACSLTTHYDPAQGTGTASGRLDRVKVEARRDADLGARRAPATTE